MTTGDKVLALLGAKALCCVLLVLAATGALGGLGAWLIDGAGRWLIAGAILAAIAAIVFGRQRCVHSDNGVEEIAESGVLPERSSNDASTGRPRDAR